MPAHEKADQVDRGAGVASLTDRLAALERFYGPLPTPPNDPFRAYVWEALSTQTTAGRRDAAYAALQRIPALTPDALFRAPRGKIAAAVALAGPYQEQRVQALLGGVQQFRRHPHLSARLRGPLRTARRAVACLPRLGDGSVYRLLLFGGDQCVMPVDRETVRVCLRLALADADGASAAGRVRRAVARLLPPDAAAFKRSALYLRHHAVQTCTDDPHCSVCPLNRSCPSARMPPSA